MELATVFKYWTHELKSSTILQPPLCPENQKIYKLDQIATWLALEGTVDIWL